MSRIANYPVVLPDKVEVTVNHDEVSVKGPLGTLTQKLSPRVKIDRIENRLEFKVNDNSRQANALSGTTRALVANMVTGVTKGFERKLTLARALQGQGRALCRREDRAQGNEEEVRRIHMSDKIESRVRRAKATRAKI